MSHLCRAPHSLDDWSSITRSNFYRVLRRAGLARRASHSAQAGAASASAARVHAVSSPERPGCAPVMFFRSSRAPGAPRQASVSHSEGTLHSGPQQALSDAAAAAAGANVQAGARPPRGPLHAIILVNGLYGGPENWTYICRALHQELGASCSAYLLHPSRVNSNFDTFHGIDVCGDRLAAEIAELARQNPRLERISIVAHSMGGLLSR